MSIKRLVAAALLLATACEGEWIEIGEDAGGDDARAPHEQAGRDAGPLCLPPLCTEPDAGREDN